MLGLVDARRTKMCLRSQVLGSFEVYDENIFQLHHNIRVFIYKCMNYIKKKIGIIIVFKHSPSGSKTFFDEALKTDLVRRRLALGTAARLLAFGAIIKAERRRAQRTERIQLTATSGATIVQLAETTTRHAICGGRTNRIFVGSVFRHRQCRLGASGRDWIAVGLTQTRYWLREENNILLFLFLNEFSLHLTNRALLPADPAERSPPDDVIDDEQLVEPSTAAKKSKHDSSTSQSLMDFLRFEKL